MENRIFYRSQYGSSRQYALWLAEELNGTAQDIKKAPVKGSWAGVRIIYIGGLYAGRVNGFARLMKQLGRIQPEEVLLCMVGLTDPRQQEKYRQVYSQNVPERFRTTVRPFALRGDQLFSKMSMLHRFMMKMPKRMAEKIPEEKRTEEDWRFIRSYGKDVRFTARENLQEIINYVKSNP